MVFLICFNSFSRGNSITLPQVKHLIRVSTPAFNTSQILPPQGCSFRNSSLSPTVYNPFTSRTYFVFTSAITIVVLFITVFPFNFIMERQGLSISPRNNYEEQKIKAREMET